MIVAVHQPNYIPWIGYFDKMDQADIFVILDAVQHSRTGFTHRNSIKSSNGPLLLSLPIHNKGRPINQLRINNSHNWYEQHWKSLEYNYRRSEYWAVYEHIFKPIYQSNWTLLIDLNMTLIRAIKQILHLDTRIVFESELGIPPESGSSRIINICKHLGAATYLSGVGAKSYNNPNLFEANGIKLHYQSFIHPVYKQPWGDFISHLSVIDAIFNCGSDTIAMIREYRKKPIDSEEQYA